MLCGLSLARRVSDCFLVLCVLLRTRSRAMQGQRRTGGGAQEATQDCTTTRNVPEPDKRMYLDVEPLEV